MMGDEAVCGRVQGQRLGLLQAVKGLEVKVRKVVCAYRQGKASEVSE